MAWLLSVHWLYFVGPAGCLFLIMTGGWWSDNCGGFPWKYWTQSETVGAFLLGPSCGLFVASATLTTSLFREPSFIFERWFTALLLLMFSTWSVYRTGTMFGRRSPEDQLRRDRMLQRWRETHPILS